MMRHFGVEPLLVFDGDRLPAKAAEESERRERRAARQADGHAALARGDKRAAESAFQSAIDVTPAMAREVMDGLAAEGFAFVVAPYEADSQLAHLARTGAVDIVATEDSDLAAYAVPLILFKLDQHGGAVELRIGDVLKQEAGAAAASDGAAAEADDSPPAEPGIEADDPIEVDDDEEEDEDAPVVATRRGGGGKGSRGGGAPLSFRRFDAELFLCLCVLAGCDFLRSLPGVGFRRAHALCLRAGTAPRLLALLRRDARLAVPPAYVAGFVRALHTFRHARVYDAAARAVRPLTPLPAELLADDVSTAFLGPEVPDDEARGVAEGRLDPFTRRPFAPRQQPGAKGGHGRPPGSSPMRAWPYESAAPRRRSGGGDGVALRLSPRREPRPAPPTLPPAPMNTSLAGMGHLLGAVVPPPPMPLPMPAAESVQVWGADDDVLVSPAPPAPPPARAANPFVRQPGDGKPMPQRVSSMFARAAADAVGKENGKAAAQPPPPPAMPAVPRGPLGRMCSGALSNGMAWIPDADEQAGPSRPPPQQQQQPKPKPAAPKQPAAAGGIARFFAPAAAGAAPAAKRPAAGAAAPTPKRRK